MILYKDIRNTMYETQFNRWSELINIKSPYTFLKSIYYMESAVIFLFLTQSFISSPNFITILYLLAGMIGSFLLNTTDISLQVLGIFLVFTKGTFDWADGPLARRLGKTSFIGHSLDTYGAIVSDTAFRISFAYYVLLENQEYMYLFPVIAFLLAITNFNVHSHATYVDVATISMKDEKSLNNHAQETSLLRKLFRGYTSILDSRSRSIDSLLLLLIIDMFFDYDLSFFLLILLCLIILRAFIMHLGYIYLATKTYEGK